MLRLFRAVIDRLKALLASAAAQELEADYLSRHAERKAELLRQADRYAAEGLHPVAQELRRQAEALSLERPASSCLPALAHWQPACDTALPPANPEAVLPLVPAAEAPAAPAEPAEPASPSANGRRKAR